MTKIVKLLTIIFVTGISFLLIANEASSVVPLVVKGKITDEFSGSPMSLTVEFRTNDGKKIKVKTQNDGLYQQVLNSGETVEVYFYNYNVLRIKQTYQVPDKDEYQEIEQNFTVKKLVKGNSIYKLDFFSKSKSSINGTADSFLKDLNITMRFNRHVKFDFYVDAHDTYSSSSKKIKSLVAKRMESLTDQLKKYPLFRGRINVIADNSKPKGKANSNNPDIVVKVNDIKNIFE